MEKYIEKLKKYGQEHILKIMKNFNDIEKAELINQINEMDLENINNLYNAINKVNLNYGNVDIEPISALKKSKIDEKELENINNSGKDIICSGKFAVATMAGGQGTRLGYSNPKGTYKIDVNPKPKYLFEIVCDTLKRANKKYNVIIPWYIMTSIENNDIIVDFFKDNNYFGYPEEEIMFFNQGQMPLIDDMEKRGIKWLFIGSIDNVLLKMVDPTLIGLAENKGVQIATKSVLKNNPKERVGVICKKDGKVGVIEYSEIPDKLANAVDSDGELIYGESHIMCNLFSIDILKTLAKVKLPYHKAHKKNSYINEKGEVVKPEEPNSYKFETFIFDSFNYVDNIAILRGSREVDFAPVKNKEGVDSPETAKKLYNEYWKNHNE